MHDIEYYDDSWDSSCFFVCIDRYYIFAADRKSKSPKWEFIDPRGIRWDAVHQRIYRNGRADKVSKEDLPANFPPPPDSIPAEAINLPPLPKQAPLLAETYPAVAKHLSAFDFKWVFICIDTHLIIAYKIYSINILNMPNVTDFMKPRRTFNLLLSVYFLRVNFVLDYRKSNA